LRGYRVHNMGWKPVDRTSGGEEEFFGVLTRIMRPRRSQEAKMGDWREVRTRERKRATSTWKTFFVVPGESIMTGRDKIARLVE